MSKPKLSKDDIQVFIDAADGADRPAALRRLEEQICASSILDSLAWASVRMFGHRLEPADLAQEMAVFVAPILETWPSGALQRADLNPTEFSRWFRTRLITRLRRHLAREASPMGGSTWAVRRARKLDVILKSHEIAGESISLAEAVDEFNASTTPHQLERRKSHTLTVEEASQLITLVQSDVELPVEIIGNDEQASPELTVEEASRLWNAMAGATDIQKAVFALVNHLEQHSSGTPTRFYLEAILRVQAESIGSKFTELGDREEAALRAVDPDERPAARQTLRSRTAVFAALRSDRPLRFGTQGTIDFDAKITKKARRNASTRSGIDGLMMAYWPERRTNHRGQYVVARPHPRVTASAYPRDVALYLGISTTAVTRALKEANAIFERSAAA